MGRSRENLKRQRSSRSKDFGYHTKRHIANTAYRACNIPSEENTGQSNTYGSTLSFSDVTTFAQIPYYSWNIYFFNQEYNQDSLTVAKIDALIEFFEKSTSQSLTCNIEIDLTFDINLCTKDFTLLRKWPSIMEDMNVNPHHTFSCMRAAFFEVIMRRSTASKNNTVMDLFRTLRLNRINIINHEWMNALPHLKLSSYGKLVSIGGIVINTGMPKLGSSFVVLACECKREIITMLERGTYFVPRKCNVCGNGKFKRLLDLPYQFTEIEQTIQIKDSRPTDQITEDGAISPNIMNVKLAGALIDKFVTGDKVRVIGIPRSIKSQPDVFSLLVKSLCPTVQGHEIIKATLILELFGGSFGCRETRDYVHTLIIGNLGLGKSQMLRACAKVVPKGDYVRGSLLKSLEPTMIKVRETGIDGSRLETGAFTSTSEGVCCIDELDKISAQHQSIHTCMEDRRVNITNSDIKLDLEARTAIIGMINPIKKHYDLSKTVVENVNASQELLSRFDIVVLMRDHPDPYRDKLMCNRMIDVHMKRAQLTERTQFSGSTTMNESSARAYRSITERLVTSDDSRADILPQNIFQMYVHYARMYVKPIISSGPKAVIKWFSMYHYQAHKDFVSTERFVRTLVILSQGCAKIDLRDEVTERDVLNSIEILQHARSTQMNDQPVDRTLTSSNNSNKLTANKVNQFLSVLRIEATQFRKSTFTTDELRTVAGKENVTGHAVSNLLSKLNEQGYLLKVSSNRYKLISN